MRGRPPLVDHVKTAFLREIQSAKELVQTVNQLKGGINPAGKPGLHPKYVRQVIELAFMGVVASWEEFLEMALVRYVAGAKTKSGYAPTPKFGLAISIQHAYEVISNNAKYDPAKDYLKVTEPKWVTNTADFFFSVHGFAGVKASADLLGHATSIRNRVAHSSEKCRLEFKKTAIHFLAPPDDKLAKGYGPGDLLMEPVARHFGQLAIQQNKNHFMAYADLFEKLAVAAVP